MANSNAPLAPGYVPQKPGEGKAPLTPGWYPGKPRSFYRKPGEELQPIPEFTEAIGGAAVVDEFLGDARDFAEKVAMLPIAAPKWVLERMGDDFDKAFRVQVKGPEDVPTHYLDDYDISAAPGAAGVSININPIKWIKDPKKQIKKTVKGWAKIAFDLSDYETGARASVWQKLIDEDPFASGSGIFDRGTQRAAHAQAGVPIVTSAGKNPLALRGIPVYKDRLSKGQVLSPRAVFHDVGNAFVSYQKHVTSPITREGKFNDLLGAISNATATEVEQSILSPSERQVIEAIFPGEAWVGRTVGKKRSMLHDVLREYDSGNLTPTQAASLANLVARRNDIDKVFGFLERVELAQNVERLAGAQKKLEKGLNRVLVKGKLKGKTAAESAAEINKLSKRWEDQLKLVKGSLGGWDKSDSVFTNPIRGRLEQMVDTQLLATGAAGFNGLGQGDMGISLAGGRVEGIRKAIAKSGQDNTILGGITRTTGITKGSKEDLLFTLAKEISSHNDPNAIGKYIVQNNLHSERLKFYVRNATVDRYVAKIEEVHRQFSRGKWLETYIWNPISKKISPYKTLRSPSEWVKAGVDRVQHSAGLVLDNKRLKTNPRFDFSDLSKDPGFLFGNHFSIEISGLGRVKFWGGDQFEAVDELVKMSALLKEKVGANQVASYLRKFIDGDIELLELTASGRYKLTSFAKSLGFVDRDIGDLKELLNGKAGEPGLLSKIDTFRNWIEKQVGMISDQQWLDTVRYLGRISNSQLIGHRFVGALQRVFQAAGRIQAYIRNLPVIGDLFGFKELAMESIKASVRRLVTRLTTKLINFLSRSGLQGAAQALGSLAPGIGNLIVGIVVWIVQKFIDLIINAVKKVFEKMKEFFKEMVLQGNISYLMDEWEAHVEKQTKRWAWIGILLLVTVVLLSTLFGLSFNTSLSKIGTITQDPFSDGIPFALSTFASVDPTRKHSSRDQAFDWSKVYVSSGACTGEIFSAIPNVPPASDVYYRAKLDFNNITLPLLMKYPVLEEAYAHGEKETGIPCEIFAGIHFKEGGNNPWQNLQEGADISPEELKGSVITAARSIANGGGCGFGLGPAGIKACVSSWDINTYVLALSAYNGGGNRQCGPGRDGSDGGAVLVTERWYGCSASDYGGIGWDDEYMTDWLNSDFVEMSNIYPADGVTADVYCNTMCGGSDAKPICAQCPPPLVRSAAGAITVAVLFGDSL